jgi:YgiT-type zinc finger domain-containing protein
MSEQAACPRCQIGNLQPHTATYSAIHNGMLLSVPNTPVWKCDICQYTEFDYDTLTRLEALTGRFGMPDDRAPQASKLPAVDTETTENKLPSRIKP